MMSDLLAAALKARAAVIDLGREIGEVFAAINYSPSRAYAEQLGNPLSLGLQAGLQNQLPAEVIAQARAAIHRAAMQERRERHYRLRYGRRRSNVRHNHQVVKRGAVT